MLSQPLYVKSGLKHVYMHGCCNKGVEILTGLMFLVALPDRSADTLFEFMKRYIRKGSIITVGN